VNFLGVMIPLTFHLISVFLRAFGFLECHSLLTDGLYYICIIIIFFDSLHLKRSLLNIA